MLEPSSLWQPAAGAVVAGSPQQGGKMKKQNIMDKFGTKRPVDQKRSLNLENPEVAL